MLIVESLIDGSMGESENWDDAWRLAKWMTHGGDPEGNVHVHDTNYYERTTYHSEFAPGRRMSDETRRRIASHLPHFAADILQATPAHWNDDDDDDDDDDCY